MDAFSSPDIKTLLQREYTNSRIDALLKKQLPRKPVKRSHDTVRKALEEEFLVPSQRFPVHWLDELQQQWEDSMTMRPAFTLSSTMTRTIIRFTREGMEGRVTGYKEVTVPAQAATAKNSTSLLRQPTSRTDFVRGKAGSFPFAPGGLDLTTSLEASELVDSQYGLVSDGFLEIAPGLARGLVSDAVSNKPSSAEDFNAALQDNFEFGDVQSRRKNADVVVPRNKIHKKRSTDHDEAIDGLLPLEFPLLEARSQLGAAASIRQRGREWAHMVDVNQELGNFHELVPSMARTWPFELDNFQKEAIYHLESGDSVFVAAHTSAGKTVVAEYAIAMAAKHMTKVIYTSPIKALSNQKFRDFRQVFDDVGILTGDVQINPEASCLIMTTEILRSMLYRGADLIRDVEFVIFDEVHYVNDQERGVVWEEVIIMLPNHINLILLSATVPNTYEFASWVGRTKKKDIYVISTPKRPVPLEHFIWANKKTFKIVDANKKFLMNGWKDANDAITGKSDEKTPGGGGGGGRGGPQNRGSRGTGGPNQRGGGQNRGGGQARGRGNQNKGFQVSSRGARGGGSRTSANQDKNLWVHLVQNLKKEDLLPACIFVFSKKRCEENANALSNIDYCTSSEKNAIHVMLEKSVARLRIEDRQLPQIRRIRELLSRGIAVHHGGLLPIVKEVVEILFARSLVKVLFATETFAMGLNLPTRTVVFSGIRKHDGRSFRDLLSGEYAQMSGRAGRRGLDAHGTVIIVGSGDEAPPTSLLNKMILGDPTKLQSQFRLTYNMILNLLRVEALKIEEMIKRSFSENATQTLLPEHERQVQASEANLKNLVRVDCSYCNEDLDACHSASMEAQRLSAELFERSLKVPQGKRIYRTGRLVVLKTKDQRRTIGILLADGVSSSGNVPHFQILQLVGRDVAVQQSDDIPFIPSLAEVSPGLPKGLNRTREVAVPLTAIEWVANGVLNINSGSIRKGDRTAVNEVTNNLVRLGQDWRYQEWEEVDWMKIRDLQFQETLEDWKKAMAKIEPCTCKKCPEFVTHFYRRHQQYKLQENINNLKQMISDQNLQLLPDYEQRIEVLRELNFIDESSRVQLKGRVACEINSAHELVLTELILENVLAEYEPEEIVALLSAFVFQEKTDVIPVVTPKLEKGKENILEISRKVNAVQEHHQVTLNPESDDFETRPRFGLMEVVYEWARGMTFNNITDLTDVLEGTIVRVITRLDETCREVKNAARIVGDPILFQKAEKCQEIIRRDIIACGSLYFQ